jgi:hypothetical protein
MTPKRPLLCRFGFHKWAPIEDHFTRCQRKGCPRVCVVLSDDDCYQWDQVLCSCGAEIVPIGKQYWRVANSGEVCRGNHWHKPAEQEKS